MVNTAPNGPESVEAAQRREALAALVARQESAPEPEAVVERSGREVYAGGDEARLLVKRASTLGYMTPDGYLRVHAVPGDTVTLTKTEANRLDGLGVTVSPDADLEEVAEEQAGGLWTEDQLKAAKAGELVAYVAQHPEERARVRALEETRVKTQQKGSGPRPSVLKATEPTPEADAAAEAEQQARQGDSTGPTAEEVADANQSNDAPGAGQSGEGDGDGEAEGPE